VAAQGWAACEFDFGASRETKRDPSTADGTARHAGERKSVPPSAQDDGVKSTAGLERNSRFFNYATLTP